MDSADFEVRNAGQNDLPGILEILNHYILTHHCTFDTKPWSVTQKRDWFDSCSTDGPYRLLVACKAGEILGYAHSSRWRPKNAYDITVETTVYVGPGHQSMGIGKSLMQQLLSELSGTSLHSAVAGIAQPNVPSNLMHVSLGYREVGTYRQVGFKFDKYWDVTWYQKLMSPK